MEVVNLNWQETIPIRHQVLWPDKPPEFCKVEGDEAAQHYGVKKDGVLVSVASIYFAQDSVRLRKFATLETFQSQGIGSFLFQHIIEELTHAGVSYLWFDARESAQSFYERFGCFVEGERFYKGDIPYFKMRREL